MKVTSKNLVTAKKKCVKLACEIAHLRDRDVCQMCGKPTGQMHASHIIPRSRGFWYACDPKNIVVMDSYCHRNIWHEDPARGVQAMWDSSPKVMCYCEELHYRVGPVKVGEVQEKLDDLEQQLKALKES